MKRPQNVEGLVDEFINSGYIGALERLSTPLSGKDLDFYADYAIKHNITHPEAMLFGPHGTARRAFKDWRRQQALRGQHRSNYRPKNEAMAEAYDNAFYNTRRIPRNKNKRGDIEEMELGENISRLPEGIESEISKAFGRHRQLYMSGWYKGSKRLEGDIPYDILEAMTIELLSKKDKRWANMKPSKLEKLIQEANVEGMDSFSHLYESSKPDRRALKYAWNDARQIINNYAEKLWQNRDNYGSCIARKKQKDFPGTIFLNNGSYYWMPKKGEKSVPLVPEKNKNKLPGSLYKNNPGGYFWWVPHHKFRRRMIPDGQKTATKDYKTATKLQKQEWANIKNNEPELAGKLMNMRNWGGATKHKPTAVKVAKKLWYKMQQEEPLKAARIMSDKRPLISKPDIDTVWPNWTDEKARLALSDNKPTMPIVYQRQDIHDEWKYGLRAPSKLEKTVDKVKNINWLKKHAMLVFDDNTPAASKQIAIQSNGRNWSDMQEQNNNRYTIDGSTSIDKDTGRFRVDIYRPGFNNKNVLTEEIYHIVYGIIGKSNSQVYDSTQKWYGRQLKDGGDPSRTIEESFASNMALEENGTKTSLPRNVVRYAKKIFSDKGDVDDAVIKEVKSSWPYHG